MMTRAQGATIAAIYGDLGFERLAINERTIALSRTGNASGTRVCGRLLEHSAARYRARQRGAPGPNKAARFNCTGSAAIGY